MLVSGASGLIGKAVVGALRTPSAANHFNPQVYTLVRRQPQNSNEIFWDPAEMRIDVARCEGFDAVIHLAGENIGSGEGILAFTGRWNDRKKHAIFESRRRGTKLLSMAMAAVRQKPAVLLSASGVGFYGRDQGDKILTEASPSGEGFLAEVSRVWEDETAPAREAGVRVVNMRLAPLLAGDGGMISKMYLPFFMGMGGPIGSGNQWMSWVAKDDAIRAIEFAMRRTDISGPVNICSPNPVQNKEFVAAFAKALGRPAFMPMPEIAVKTVFGEMGEETLLASQRAVPEKLLAAGFRFEYPDVQSAVAKSLA